MTAVADQHDSTFPLLTLEWLQADPTEATTHFPPGVAARTWNAGVLFWDIEGEPKWACMLDLLLGAILAEAARFRGSVGLHSNRSPDDSTATFFLRFVPSLTGSTAGSFTVSRIVMDAKANEKVPTAANPMDLRRESLILQMGSSAKLSARKLLMDHARRCAVESGWSETDQSGYLTNLARLLDRYDTDGSFTDLTDEEIDAAE